MKERFYDGISKVVTMSQYDSATADKLDVGALNDLLIRNINKQAENYSNHENKQKYILKSLTIIYRVCASYSIYMPVSSITSRRAQANKPSLNSRCPPGAIHTSGIILFV